MIRGLKVGFACFFSHLENLWPLPGFHSEQQLLIGAKRTHAAWWRTPNVSSVGIYGPHGRVARVSHTKRTPCTDGKQDLARNTLPGSKRKHVLTRASCRKQRKQLSVLRSDQASIRILVWLWRGFLESRPNAQNRETKEHRSKIAGPLGSCNLVFMCFVLRLYWFFDVDCVCVCFPFEFIDCFL